ncbi:hypothetical protein DQ04_01061130 [Trypanosoma grayi]|uniref:hypothetical protein n=1 Tax=Trypanosoma grayi TaxID=71804 RepID=UPI0004F4A34D|nr:hypothetical protein DQ04_01061130 [Trypanosoma grayi]KEG13345.1 hypothetical protein DQ04_01061130 [Trypanosoma grayi]
MQQDLPECLRVVSGQKTRGDEALAAALEDIHRFVFGGDDDSTEIPTPSKLLSFSEAAVGRVGSHLGKRKLSELARLPIVVVIVEVLARLARVLFWGMAAPPGKAPCRCRKTIESDVEELEEILLPRFFLKLSVRPQTLRDVLMKSPWDAFSHRYGTGSTSPAESCESAPIEVVTALRRLKINFGCDFLFHIRVNGGEIKTNATLTETVTEADGRLSMTPWDTQGDCSTPNDKGNEESKDCVGIRRACSPCTRSSTLAPAFDMGAAQTEPQESTVHRKTLVAPVRGSCAVQPAYPRHSLPAYMLTRRRSGTLSNVEMGGGCVESVGPEADQHSSLSDEDSTSSEEIDRDAEVLAPETPVKKRVRRDNGAVPPSPFRPTDKTISLSHHSKVEEKL